MMQNDILIKFDTLVSTENGAQMTSVKNMKAINFALQTLKALLTGKDQKHIIN